MPKQCFDTPKHCFDMSKQCFGMSKHCFDTFFPTALKPCFCASKQCFQGGETLRENALSVLTRGQNCETLRRVFWHAGKSAKHSAECFAARAVKRNTASVRFAPRGKCETLLPRAWPANIAPCDPFKNLLRAPGDSYTPLGARTGPHGLLSAL